MARTKTKTRGAAVAAATANSANPLAREWQHIPKLVVFDLDFTLWLPEMYELYGAPFKKNATTGIVTDRSGEEVHFFPAVHTVLSILELDPQFMHETEVAAASKTTEPHWAKTCMRLMDVTLTPVDGNGAVTKKSLQSIMDFEAIYPRNKRVHFEQLKEQSGVAYEDMLFFDNEYGNIVDVGKLGVVCAYCPQGLSEGSWLQGMEAFQKAKRNE
ncbi:Magnesium-dependent phosphatase-1, partial [Globisporangium splendens]